MQEKILSIIDKYYKERNFEYEITKTTYGTIIKNKEILTDVDLLRYIFLNFKAENKGNYEFFNLVTKSFKFCFSTNTEDERERILDLVYSNLIELYHGDNDSLGKFVEILNELDKKQLVNLVESNFRKENSDEIKIFSQILFYYAKNLSNVKIDFEKFIYCKKFDLIKIKNEIIRKISDEKYDKYRLVKILKECIEILDIFDEIYDTKIFVNLNKYITEIDKIFNNKLLITDENDKFIIQMIVKNESIEIVDSLIRKIKKLFDKNVEIILFINEYNNDLIYQLLKQDLISNLIIKNSLSKNSLMLKNNKDLFIYYDLNAPNTKDLIENEFILINKYLAKYFEILYLVFNQNYKFHKVKLCKNLSSFAYYIKEIEQNYFNINEYNDEKDKYSLYLYSEDNTFCYELFCKKFPILEEILKIWLKYDFDKNIPPSDNLNSLIAIRGYNLIVRCTEINKPKYYDKILFQESLEIDDDYALKPEFEKLLEQKSIGFNTKNIYIVDNLDEYINIKNNLPSYLMNSYIKRNFNDLLPVFYFIFKKYPILDRKPILLQTSYFMSYNLNIYKKLVDTNN